MTMNGWMKLNDLTQERSHPLIRVRMIPDAGEVDFPEVYANLFSLAYDNSDPESGKVVFSYAFSNEESKTQILN